MELYDAMSTLRAVRRLRSDPIPHDVLRRVLQAACWAPTGGNQQPWRVVVVTDPDRKKAVADIYRPQWDRYVKGFMSRMEGQPDEVVDKWRRVANAGDYLAENLSDAPVLLVWCANPANMAITDAKLDRISMVGGGSVYPAVQNALLAARAEGLGCVLTTLTCLDEAALKAALDIPERWATVGVVPLGYPVNKGHGPITRQPPEELAFADTFGSPWA